MSGDLALPFHLEANPAVPPKKPGGAAEIPEPSEALRGDRQGAPKAAPGPEGRRVRNSSGAPGPGGSAAGEVPGKERKSRLKKASRKRFWLK